MKKDIYLRKFLSLFGEMDKRFDFEEIWSDFLTMSACAISNQADPKHRDERETIYMNTVQKYSKDDAFRIKDMLWLSGADLLQNRRDFLCLVSEELGMTNKHIKQYYTPHEVSSLIAKIVDGELDKGISAPAAVDIIDKKGYINVLDCCCGTGSLLIGFIDEIDRQMKKQQLNYQNHVQIIAQDLSYKAALACYVQLSLLGCAGFVVIGSPFSKPAGTKESIEDAWYTPAFFSDVWIERRRWHYLDQLIKMHSKP